MPGQSIIVEAANLGLFLRLMRPTLRLERGGASNVFDSLILRSIGTTERERERKRKRGGTLDSQNQEECDSAALLSLCLCRFSLLEMAPRLLPVSCVAIALVAISSLSAETNAAAAVVE